MNDLENIVPFFMLSMLYLSINPHPETAAFLFKVCLFVLGHPAQYFTLSYLNFKVFSVSRILHTIVYLMKVRQPARALAFFPGILINVFMAVRLIKAAW